MPARRRSRRRGRSHRRVHRRPRPPRWPVPCPSSSDLLAQAPRGRQRPDDVRQIGLVVSPHPGGTTRGRRKLARMDLQDILREIKRSTDTFRPPIGRRAETIPDRVALKFEEEMLTYGEYHAAVNRLAAVLRRRGVERGTPVAILCLNSPLFLAALGAVAKLGA